MKAIKEGLNFVEQIRLSVNVQDINAHMECSVRIAELSKKGYKIVDTYIDEQEQNYLLGKD